MEASGWWLLMNAVSLLPLALRLDERWGISTYRQRLLHRFEAFAQRSERSRHLEALGAFAYVMGQRMRVKWPETPDMPLYPAFRDYAGIS
jgi:chromatin segregation and condensation protein Rec8/ScpA/Scc1 (kleisin family)